jgi:hypothetical protein
MAVHLHEDTYAGIAQKRKAMFEVLTAVTARFVVF